jgi:hypothetical protein
LAGVAFFLLILSPERPSMFLVGSLIFYKHDGRVSIERTLPCPEDIRTLIATNLANEFTAVFCSTDDLDGSGQRLCCSLSVAAATVAIRL